MLERCDLVDTTGMLFSNPQTTTVFCNNNIKVPLEYRYVFDIGSGGTKSKLVLVEPKSGKIIKTLKEISVPMPYQECISRSDDGRTLTKECMQKGLQSIMDIIAYYGIEDINDFKNAGIATAWARNAKNSDEYLQLLSDHGLNVRVISQQEEGEIGYKVAQDHGASCEMDERMAIIWDIGGGSYQLSAQKKDGSIHVHQGPYGSSNFNKDVRDYIKEKYNDDNNQTLFDKLEIEAAREFAKLKVSDSIASDEVLASLMKDKCVDLVAMGQFMNLGIKPSVRSSGYISKEKINHAILSGEDKHFTQAQELFPMRDERFINVVQTDLILTEAIMQGLSRDSFIIVNAKSVDFVATDSSFWNYEFNNMTVANDTYPSEVNCLHLYPHGVAEIIVSY
jgi:exopolyphosphatase/guanosine-5'-triphosphate,3'-diphosphate pyrophosphatase